MGTRIVLLVVALFCTNALAGQDFSCGAARVTVSAEPNDDPNQDFGYAGVLTIETRGHQTILQYRGNVDFLGATCSADQKGRSKILFQAVCGGSGCRDLDNWGIVDANTLRVELIPSDNNLAEVRERLGDKSFCTDLVSLATTKIISNECHH